MRVIRFDPNQELPVIEASIKGPKGQGRIRLVFDTGAGSTQIDTGRMEAVGYSARNADCMVSVRGPAGDTQDGYLVNAEALYVFGKSFPSIPVGVYDFDNFARYGIDGLLGFDVIKQLHLEMDGPSGVLRIF